ncbi:phage protease [Sediminispirochaeta bajacaliforniensis]|uniref:phage protease n=1 Tax=Sediminispirochaeta bajacaliforniensis TaxID=148 RepID=UPI000372DEFC|nr:phage protease [Sediminispirochaeta bajacaliforniensis]
MKHGSLFFALNIEQGKAPQRIQLLPAGNEIKGRDGRRWTNPNPEAVVTASNADLPRLVIDVNHATDYKAPKGEEAPAMGWFFSLSVNALGETWADVEWNSWGRSSVEGLLYRYISPVFEYDENGQITKIIRAALTNVPNLRLEALNSEMPPTGREEKSMKEILAALGLAETATEQDAVQTISVLKTANNAQANGNATAQGVDLTKYAPRADLNQMEQRALNAEKRLKDIEDFQQKEKATAAVDKAIADRKISPASKKEYLALCSTQSGLDSFTRIMEKTPAIISKAPQVPDDTPPEGETALNAEEVSVSKSAGYSPEEWKKIKEAAK